MIYDVSNACLGLLTGMMQVANMIELGQIRAGVVVGTECGRELVENTIELFNTDTSLTRDSVKDYIASLTIGSASAAIVLCDEELSRTGNRLTTAVVHCDTSQHDLCQSRGLETMMRTDSETLMRRASRPARRRSSGSWRRPAGSPTTSTARFAIRSGVAHRKLMFESLALDPAIDFATLETLGNTGAAALPITMALGIEQGRLRQGDRVAMLGIGSGINCLMLAVEWQKSRWTAQQMRIKSPRHGANRGDTASIRQFATVDATLQPARRQCEARSRPGRPSTTTATAPIATHMPHGGPLLGGT